MRWEEVEKGCKEGRGVGWKGGGKGLRGDGMGLCSGGGEIGRNREM